MKAHTQSYTLPKKEEIDKQAHDKRREVYNHSRVGHTLKKKRVRDIKI